MKIICPFRVEIVEERFTISLGDTEAIADDSIELGQENIRSCSATGSEPKISQMVRTEEGLGTKATDFTVGSPAVWKHRRRKTLAY